MCEFLPSKHRLLQLSRQSFNIHWLSKHLPNTDLPSLCLDNPVSGKPYGIQSSVSWEIPTVSDSVELKLEGKSPKEKWQSELKQIKYYTIPVYQREMLLSNCK